MNILKRPYKNAIFKFAFWAWLRILASYVAKIALLDILAYNSANNPYIQYPTKNPFAQCSIDVKRAVTF